MSLDELANWTGDRQPGSAANGAGQAEFLKRQTQAAQEAAQATKDAADAGQRNARYMLWSVIALAVSATLSLAVQIAGLWLQK